MIGDSPLQSTLVPVSDMLPALGYPTLLQKVLGKVSLGDSIAAFQKSVGLEADGKVGPKTALALEAAFNSACSSRELDPLTTDGLAKCKSVVREEQKKKDTKVTLIATSGGLLLLIGVLMLVGGKKKSGGTPAVAGYHRRRRRRRR